MSCYWADTINDLCVTDTLPEFLKPKERRPMTYNVIVRMHSIRTESRTITANSREEAIEACTEVLREDGQGNGDAAEVIDIEEETTL